MPDVFYRVLNKDDDDDVAEIGGEGGGMLGNFD